MKFVRKSSMLLLAFLALGHQAIALAQSSPERNIRLATCVPEDHPITQGAIKFVDVMNKLSQGKIKAKVFHSCQLGSDTQTVAAVRGGVQEMTIVSSAPVATIIKEFMLFDLPFLFQSEKEADAVLDGKLGQRLLDLATPKNMIGLCYWENGFRQTTNSKRPVNAADDLSGLKLRVMQNPVYIDTFKTLGTNAIPMPFTELYTALESKAIDAQENPLANTHSSKLYEVQKYLSMTNHAYAPLVVLVSKAFWDKLDKNEQAILRTGCNEARDFERTYNRNLNKKLLDDLKTKGMVINTVSAAETAKMRERTTSVIERYKQEIGAAIVEEAQKEITAIRGK